MSKKKFKIFTGIMPLLIVTASVFFVAFVLCITLGGMNIKAINNEAERKELLTAKIIPNGVTVNGMDVGGMDYNEAVLALKEAESAITDNIEFTLKYEDISFTLNSDCFDIKFNTEDIVREALGMITETGYLELKQYVEKVEKEGVDYEIEYTIDAALLEKELEGLCQEVYVAPVNAKAVLDKDFKASYSSVVNKNPFRFEKDVDGLEVDKEALIQTLTERIGERDFGEVELPVKKVEADITLSKIKKNTVLRDWFHTSYSEGNGANRVHNIKTAANYLNGTCVKPGEVFSMEATIGRRVDPEIWREAAAVISGGAATENQLGGGVCQVSTTLYNALVKSDMKIVFRKNHSKASSYVDPGLDATINTDTIDFKWKNDTDYDVYVFSWLDTGRENIYCAVYGAAFPDEFDNIEFKSTLNKKIEPTETEYTKTSKLKEGEWCLMNKAITGYLYDSYAYYYKDGKLVDTKFVDDSHYKMHPLRYYVWSGYKAGAALDPWLEMVRNEDGSFTRKYNKPVESPSPSQSPAPDPTAEPTPTANP